MGTGQSNTEELLSANVVALEKSVSKAVESVVTVSASVATLASSVEFKLIKVEDKLDAIAVSLTSLVRIEERQSAMATRLTDGSTTMADHNKRIVVLESLANQGKGAKNVIVWVIGVMQLAALGLIGIVASNLGTIQDKMYSIEIRQQVHEARNPLSPGFQSQEKTNGSSH